MTLIEAIKANNQAEFFRLLNLKTDPLGKRVIDEVDAEHEGSALYWAAALGHSHFMDPLVKAGANVDTPDKYLRPPVWMAAANGHAQAITALKAAGAVIDTQTMDGATPVSVAAVMGHVETVIALKTAGANVNTPMKNGTTPLCGAAQEGHVAVVTVLLEAGADASINTPNGTALEQARKSARPGCPEVVRLLEAHLQQYPNGIKTTMNTNKAAAALPTKSNPQTEQNNLPTLTAKPTSQNSLEPLLSGLSLQASPVVPVVTPHVVFKNESSQKAHQPVGDFVPEVCRHDTVAVEAKAGRDVTTVVGGVRSPGAIDIGGGSTSSSAEASSSSSGSNTKEEAEVDNIAVLKQLKLFFMSNKYKGAESADCGLYNSALEAHKAALVYDEDARVHKLFVNDEPLEPRDSIKKITQMIDSVKLLNAQSASRMPNAFSSTATQGNTRVQARAGRDVITITGGISSGGALRIGGGDTQRTFTAYDQFRKQDMNKYNNGLGNSSRNIQLSIRTEISKVIKSINHVKI